MSLYLRTIVLKKKKYKKKLRIEKMNVDIMNNYTFVKYIYLNVDDQKLNHTLNFLF